jgi:serine/threonine-protein kinase
MGYMIGSYEVLEKLGSGGMGDVFKGRDPKTTQIVAIKILSEELSSNERGRERFKREVQQSVQLKHPSLIAAYSSGEFKGRLYYVMEFVNGVTAKKELLGKGPFEESRAIEIMIQIAEALNYAHQKGIIHRDIKPDNIMITYDGKAKLCDMGLAKSTEGGEVKLTLMGTVLGTPHYMSPEQAKGEEKLDTRSDIFSLGSTCYHLLTASPPFEGNEPVAIMNALVEKEPVSMVERNSKITEGMCAVIAKMMAKDREKRYQTPTELLEDLLKLKKKEVTSAEQGGYAPKSKLRQQKFLDSFYPSETDVLIGQIALHNKLVTIDKLDQCLHRQEALALVGIELTLSDVLLEQKVVNPQQKALLEKAKLDTVMNRSDEIFLKACGAHNLLNEKETNEVQKLRKAQIKGLGGYLVALNLLDGEKRLRISSAIKHAFIAEESKQILKVALENSILSQPQIEKCSRIYTNNVVMGKYRDLGSILLEKGFLVPEALKALLRAVRRSMITGKPAVQYLKQVTLAT